MKKPPLPPNENIRIKSLQELNILDTPAEERFDRITQAASKMFNMPIALVSLIDSKRQWFKSAIGTDVPETPRDISFCAHAILDTTPLVVKNALNDKRFYNNPLVAGETNIRFYAGSQLKHPNGSVLGTLCLIDTKPRELTPDELECLQELATFVELELVSQQSVNLDPECNISNKDGFHQLADCCLHVCQKKQLPVVLSYFFVKELAGLQDEFDQKVYQQALNIIVNGFKAGFRSSDIIARYEDTGFVALMSNSNKNQANALLQATIKKINLDLSYNIDCHDVKLISGVIEAVAKENLEELIFNAFYNSYQKK